MENKKEVLIIIPAYNEEKNIVSLLEKLEQPEIAQIADVLIMNDASSDATNYVVKKRNHEVVTHVFNLGYGTALSQEEIYQKIQVLKDACDTGDDLIAKEALRSVVPTFKRPEDVNKEIA